MLSTSTTPEIEFRHVAKSFGSCRAAEDLSFGIQKGSIHAIVGENGAGKSTAMNLLYGLYPRDSGEILVHGSPVFYRSPAEAKNAGIGMIHQHFSLSGTETVLDNIVLGSEPTPKQFEWLPKSLRPIDREAAHKKLSQICQEYSLHVDLTEKIENLSVGLKQRVEILKLLYKEAEILILDEPTAVLTPQEIISFFQNLRLLKNKGKTILIITHKLEEVLSLSDAITVFKSGKVVGSLATRDATPEKLAEMMVGRHVNLRTSPHQYRLEDTETPLLSFKNVSLKQNEIQLLNNLSFDIKRGEIVGIAGVQGNGQSEIEALLIDPYQHFQKNKTSSGAIFLENQPLNQLTTSELSKRGIAFVTEDRHKDGLIPSFSCLDNFLLGLQYSESFQKGLFINWKNVRASAQQNIQKFGVKVQSMDRPVSELSGGNQQKLIFAREFSKNPKFLLAAQPTRGVDVGAIEFIHEQLKNLQQQGAGILLISSDLTEVLSLSNRILVLSKGRIINSFLNSPSVPRDQLENQIGLAMGGMKS